MWRAYETDCPLSQLGLQPLVDDAPDAFHQSPELKTLFGHVSWARSKMQPIKVKKMKVSMMKHAGGMICKVSAIEFTLSWICSLAPVLGSAMVCRDNGTGRSAARV